MRCAPKFENSHQRSPGLALTALRTQGQPTPSTSTKNSPSKRRRSGGIEYFMRRSQPRPRAARRLQAALRAGQGGPERTQCHVCQRFDQAGGGVQRRDTLEAETQSARPAARLNVQIEQGFDVVRQKPKGRKRDLPCPRLCQAGKGL